MFTTSDAETQNEPSDEALLYAIAGGAVWAMESLYERYSRIFYSLAYRMVADHQIAEDLLQDTFLAIWRHATTYSPQKAQHEAGLFPSCITARLIIYAACAAAQLFKKRH
jgi:RNA polymerase sigma-70 factor, ECF subfamily